MINDYLYAQIDGRLKGFDNLMDQRDTRSLTYEDISRLRKHTNQTKVYIKNLPEGEIKQNYIKILRTNLRLLEMQLDKIT